VDRKRGCAAPRRAEADVTEIDRGSRSDEHAAAGVEVDGGTSGHMVGAAQVVPERQIAGLGPEGGGRVGERERLDLVVAETVGAVAFEREPWTRRSHDPGKCARPDVGDRERLSRRAVRPDPAEAQGCRGELALGVRQHPRARKGDRRTERGAHPKRARVSGGRGRGEAHLHGGALIVVQVVVAIRNQAEGGAG
jgi:hypothetical protein